MGVFSNIWKGVKKTFKKIGKGVKGAFKKFGKFMGKAGILGTVAMGLLTGGMGFGAMLGNFGATLAGSGSALLRGAGWVIGKAAQFGNMVSSGFKTLTSGVTEFFGQAGRYIGGKLGMPGMENIGMGEAWGNYSDALTKNFSQFTSDVSSFASTSATSGLKSTATQVSYDPYGSEAVKEKAMEEALSESSPSLLSRGIEKTVDTVGQSVTEVPGAVVKQGLIQAVMPGPEYEEALSMSYAPQVQFADVAGAAAAARTPMTDDQQFVQFNTPYFDGIGASNGAFGVGALYMNRLKAFSGK
jgi:hypothetical protein